VTAHDLGSSGGRSRVLQGPYQGRVTVTVTYDSDLPWPVAEDGEPLVGVVYQGL
jgi:hypothetical protein